MDKATYQKNKLIRIQNEVSYAREDFCFNCVRLSKNCLCHLIKPFQTDFHFVFLMHPMEAKKEKMGTGKLSKLTLLNSQLLVGVDFTDDRNVNAIIADPLNYCMVLYPGKSAINVSTDKLDLLFQLKNQNKRLVIFLIDGTWACAKKMMRVSDNLKELPRISFSAKHTSIFEIKEQPADFCLSTIESLQVFIQECNRVGLEKTAGAENDMLDVFKEMINFQIKCSLDPNLSSYTKGNLGYSKKEDRIRPKKWLTRNVVLAD